METQRVKEAFKKTGAVLDAVIALLNKQKGRGGVPLTAEAEALKKLITDYVNRNSWFSKNAVMHRLNLVAGWFKEEKLYRLIDKYAETGPSLRIGLAWRPDFPLQACEDALSVLLTNNKLQLMQNKERDKILEWLLKVLAAQDSRLNRRIAFSSNGFGGLDGYIVWKYQENERMNAYFGHDNTLLRGRTASVGVLTGNEDDNALAAFADAILKLFGLSHHNISKLYVPEEYNFERLYRILDEYEEVRMHHKFANNHDYHRSLFLLGGYKFLDNGFLLFRRSPELISPIAVVHYQTYPNREALKSMVSQERQVQQWIATEAIADRTVHPDLALQPAFDDFKGHQNTISWLASLKNPE